MGSPSEPHPTAFRGETAPATERVHAADPAGSREAEVVDFDALHAALGDLPPPATSSSVIGESQGQSSATYASARPHTIPPTRPPVDDVNVPAVIVAEAALDAAHSPAPQVTMPMGGVMPPHGPPPPFVAAAHPRPSHSDANITLDMGRPRPPRTPTVVMRPQGPTKLQKLLVFMAMLLVFVGGGLAILIYYRPSGMALGLRLQNPARSPPVVVPTSPAPASSPLNVMVVTATPGPALSLSAVPSSTPSATASARKPQRPTPRPSATPP
jgi:hypothetical protein